MSRCPSVSLAPPLYSLHADHVSMLMACVCGCLCVGGGVCPLVYAWERSVACFERYDCTESGVSDKSRTVVDEFGNRCLTAYCHGYLLPHTYDN
jgi:hypothetical protein